MKLNSTQIEYLNKNARYGSPIMVRVGESWYTWNEEKEGHIVLTTESGKDIQVLPSQIDQITEGVERRDVLQEIEEGIRRMVKEELNEDSVSPSYRRMLNALGNVIPMVFPNSKPGMDSPIFKFQQIVMQGRPEAQKEWPKVKKYIDKMFKDINLKKIKEEKELLKVLDKTAKGMKV